MEVKIALAQYPITYHDSLEKWKNHTKLWVQNAVIKDAKVIVFPEYGAMELVSLFDKDIQANLTIQIEKMQDLLGDFIEIFQNLAKQFDCIVIAPSFPVKVVQNYVNRVFVFSQKGFGFQDKWFMTRFEIETWGICSVNKCLSVFETSWGKFGIQTCYDIEFPIGTHLLAHHGVDVIFVPSCTETIRGASRVHTGAKARALEQQIYVAVSQTVNDAKWAPTVDINYGFAAIYTSPDTNLPENGVLKTGAPQHPSWLFETLDFSKNAFIQADGQVFNQKDMKKTSMILEEDIVINTIYL